MLECVFVIGAYLAIVAVANAADEEFELLFVRGWSHVTFVFFVLSFCIIRNLETVYLDLVFRGGSFELAWK